MACYLTVGTFDNSSKLRIFGEESSLFGKGHFAPWVLTFSFCHPSKGLSQAVFFFDPGFKEQNEIVNKDL